MRVFTQDHLWLDYEDGIVILGLTAYAASRFREDAVLKFPAESRLLSPGMPIASLESPGLLHDIRSPLAGFQLGVNRELQRSPHKLTRSPEEAGWLCQIYCPRWQPAGHLSRRGYEAFLENLPAQRQLAAIHS